MTGLPHQNELVSGLEGAIARLGISQADGVVVSEEQVELEEEEGPAAAVNGKAEQSDDAFVPDDEVAQAAPAAVAVEAEVSDDGDAVVKMDEGTYPYPCCCCYCYPTLSPLLRSSPTMPPQERRHPHPSSSVTTFLPSSAVLRRTSPRVRQATRHRYRHRKPPRPDPVMQQQMTSHRHPWHT